MRTVANLMQLLTYFGVGPNNKYENHIREVISGLYKYLKFNSEEIG